MGRLVRRHPFSLFLSLCLVASVWLWWWSGRHFDSIEFLTPKVIVTFHSEMRMMMVLAVAHDDSSWDVFHNSDIATVEAPWIVAVSPRLWGSVSSGEFGLMYVQAHLVILLFLLVVVVFWLERRHLLRRVAKVEGNQVSRGDAEAQS